MSDKNYYNDSLIAFYFLPLVTFEDRMKNFAHRLL